MRGKKNIDFKNLIKKYNSKYQISKINEFISFELKSNIMRSYYYENIIEFKIEHGLDIDKSICSDFEKKTRSNNYFFFSGVDFIYELFNFENKLNTNKFSKTVKILGKNKIKNNFFTKFADNGIII